MKAVLISIRPEWARLIVSGQKTIEIRKTRPKLETPFRCYIYQTLPKYGDWNERDGHVIGEFVCDYIRKLYYDSDICYGIAFPNDYEKTIVKMSCLTLGEMMDYLDGKDGYMWHISELKIYDKPKKLSEFKRWNRTEENSPRAHTKWIYEPCETCTECNLTRPPQSWCYIEEMAG